jgi:signal peptidase I
LSARERRCAAVLVAAVLATLAIRALALEPFAIPSQSMAPTLRPGQHVVANKLAYHFSGPRRGDLVVFREPRRGEVLLKRVVGLGGDRVGLADGVLVVNGRAQGEPYVRDRRLIDGVYFGPVTVPRHAVFVLGDRRSDSRDSRDFGAVPVGDLIGRVEARIWPLTRLGLLN